MTEDVNAANTVDDDAILQQFGLSTPPKSQPVKPTRKPDYNPFMVNIKAQEGLLIDYGNDIEEEMQYQHKVSSLRCGSTAVYIFFNHCTLEIRGQGFTKQVTEWLRQKQIAEIRVFEPSRYNDLPANISVRIDAITRREPFLIVNVDEGEN